MVFRFDILPAEEIRHIFLFTEYIKCTFGFIRVLGQLILGLMQKFMVRCINYSIIV